MDYARRWVRGFSTILADDLEEQFLQDGESCSVGSCHQTHQDLQADKALCRSPGIANNYVSK